MSERTTPRRPHRVWEDTSHASLCVLGALLQQRGILATLAQGVTIHQKPRTYTPAQKLTMLFVGILQGQRALCHLERSLRPDPALQQAFGLPGCAEQSVISDTLDAATATDVTELRTAAETLLQRHSQALQHPFAHERLVLDVDLSPAPCGKTAEGAMHGYMGQYRGKRGRKLVRVRDAVHHETLYEDVLPGNAVESLEVVKQAVAHIEALFAMAGEEQRACWRRSRTEWRMDSGWGSDAILTYLLGRGYEVTGKFRAHNRIRSLVRDITAWQDAKYANTEWGMPLQPIPFDRPLLQIATRTVCEKAKGGYRYTVFVTSRTDLEPLQVLAHYDGRAGMEADLKSDKHGLGLAAMRKGKMAAQTIVVLLTQMAHNVLLWARRWLVAAVPALGELGIVRQVREVWAIPGRVKRIDGTIRRVRLRRRHPRTHQVLQALTPLVPQGQSPGFLGQI